MKRFMVWVHEDRDAVCEEQYQFETLDEAYLFLQQILLPHSRLFIFNPVQQIWNEVDLTDAEIW